MAWLARVQLNSVFLFTPSQALSESRIFEHEYGTKKSTKKNKNGTPRQIACQHLFNKIFLRTSNYLLLHEWLKYEWDISANGIIWLVGQLMFSMGDLKAKV